MNPAKTLKSIFSVLLFLYPIIIFFILRHFNVQSASLILSVALILRLTLFKNNLPSAFSKTAEIVLWIVLVLSLANLYFHSEHLLKIYPVLMSAGMCGLFLLSLRQEQPLIEQFARLREKHLSPERRAYIRRLTQIWGIWLLINTLISIYTALFASLEVWALYNNILFYVICAGIFAVDLSYRKLVRLC